MRFFLVFTLFFSLSITHAEVSPGHVESMLQQMVRENVISAPEAERVKRRLKALGPEKWSAVNSKFSELTNRSPASAILSNNKIEEVHGVDLEGAQFNGIQNEVRKIIPDYHDSN